MGRPAKSMTSYFAKIAHPFSACPLREGATHAEAFLDACADIVPFFDLLGPSVFAPVKSDINGNIKKLRAKMATDAGLDTMEKMVLSEIDSKTTTKSGSATDALRWLKRALT